MMINAVSYARFSSNNQREASIEIQQEHIYKYCKDNGINIIKDYVDRAVSATSDNRPMFKQMIKDSESGLFTYVVVYNSSRFCRNIQDHLKYRAILEANGVKILSVNENFDESTPEGDLMSNFMMSINQYYSKDLGRKTFLGCMETARSAKCVGGKVLYGYDVVNQKYVINEEEAKVVRLIFEMISNGHTSIEICEELNNRGITKRDGKPFQAKFTNMLRNRRYIGEFIWNQYKRNKITGKVMVKEPADVVRIPNAIPSIVEEKLFFKVQEILDERSKNKKRNANSEYLLQSMMICGDCGYGICVDCNRNGNGKSTYQRIDYRCYSKLRRRAECDVKPYRLDYTDAYVLNLVNGVLLNERYAKRIYKLIVNIVGEEYERTRKRLIEQQTVLLKLKDDVRGLVGSLSEAKPLVYQEIINEIERIKYEQCSIEREIESLKEIINEHPIFSEETILKNILSLKKEMKSGKIDEIKSVLKLLIKKIIVSNDEFVIRVNLNAYLPKSYKKSLEVMIVENPINIKDKKHHLDQKLNWSSLEIRL